MKKDDILRHRVDNNPERAAAIGLALHRARKKPMNEEAGEMKPDDEKAEGPTGRAANLGKYHHPKGSGKSK